MRAHQVGISGGKRSKTAETFAQPQKDRCNPKRKWQYLISMKTSHIKNNLGLLGIVGETSVSRF